MGDNRLILTGSTFIDALAGLLKFIDFNANGLRNLSAFSCCHFTHLLSMRSNLGVHENINSQYQALRRSFGEGEYEGIRRGGFRAFAAQPNKMLRRIKCGIIFK